ncbi:mechanosensitive ion channel protein 6-like isoform X2 [Malania oleifera]|uniref:mechanosensitive ion channel protein 6-like isoform X2 n=1 Tax=Malania oleifera TaxID=397392 RepID=UPI0025AE2858|nr:mechanosensitive ion channel protein 6-like isoform X2 [Malania oleifera]
MDALRKSFKSHRHSRKISAGGGEDLRGEEQSILLDHDMTSAKDSGERGEVIVKIDGDGSGRGSAGNAIWRGSSYEFWKEENVNQKGGERGSEGFDFRRRSTEDPPSKLIGQFLHKQRASGEMSLDMDLEMDELRRDSRGLPPVAESPGDNSRTVSFQTEIVPERKYKGSSDEDEDDDEDDDEERNDRRQGSNSPAENGDGEVLRCTSNSSFQNKSNLLRLKTRSRLMDPPEQPDRKSGRVPKSSQLKSGILGKSMEEEEDDPFLEDDFPEEYKKTKFSILTLLEWLSLISIIAALVCSLTIPSFKRRTLWNLPLWKWEVMVLVLICGRLVSGWLIRMVVFFIERNFLLRKRVLYFVYGVKKAVQNCLWLGLVLIAWHYLFDKKVEKETNTATLQYVTKILVCLLVGTLLWLVKTLMVKVLASSFHVSTFFDRIQESLFNQYVIETLSGPPLVELQNAQEEEERTMAEVQRLQNAGATLPPELKAAAFSYAKSGRVIASGGLQKSPVLARNVKFSGAISKKLDDKITIDHLHKLNPKNVSAWNMKRLVNIVRHGALSTLDEQILDSTQYDENSKQIRSENEAKAAARKIFQNVARPGKRYIILQDLLRFMQNDEAVKTVSLFEGASESNKISKSALKNWVNAFRERKALALTLNDTKTAVNKLHHMVNIVVGIIIVVIWLLILGIATSKFLVFISSQLLLVVFIFGNTCKTVFEAIVFLFVMHPFDVGDRCEIDGVQMIVEEMNILTTVFLRYDNLKIIFPNSVLSTKPIFNYYRSPDMGDGIDFYVHIATPAEKIAIMKQKIISFIENKKEHWCAAPMIVLRDVEGLTRLKLSVWPTHKMNHQDMGERWERRALLVEEMVRIFKDLDIQYRLLPLDINVRSLPPPTSTRVPPNWTAPTV